jgi:hypothetical protein
MLPWLRNGWPDLRRRQVQRDCLLRRAFQVIVPEVGQAPYAALGFQYQGPVLQQMKVVPYDGLLDIKPAGNVAGAYQWIWRLQELAQYGFHQHVIAPHTILNV